MYITMLGFIFLSSVVKLMFIACLVLVFSVNFIVDCGDGVLNLYVCAIYKLIN